jgi:hypothetical protein
MNMNKKILVVIPSALIGAMAAILTNLLVSTAENGHLKDARDPARPGADSIDPPRLVHSKTILVQEDPRRLDALEREVARLRQEQEDRRVPLLDTVTPANVVSPEVERRHLERRFSELEGQFVRETVDPGWSQEAAFDLERDLASAGKMKGFAVVKSECRSETCRATLQWKSYAAALETGLLLPERTISGMNCVKSIWLKEPSTGEVAPYLADLYLECGKQRREEVDVITASIGDEK